MKKILLVLSVLVVGSISANAADWEPVGQGQYVDASSVRPAAQYGTFTFKSKAIAKDSPFSTQDGRSVWQINGDMYVDCRAAYVKEVSYSTFDEDNKVIRNKRSSSNQWTNVTPNQKAYELYSYVCGAPYARYRNDYNRWWY